MLTHKEISNTTFTELNKQNQCENIECLISEVCEKVSTSNVNMTIYKGTEVFSRKVRVYLKKLNKNYLKQLVNIDKGCTDTIIDSDTAEDVYDRRTDFNDVETEDDLGEEIKDNSTEETEIDSAEETEANSPRKLKIIQPRKLKMILLRKLKMIQLRKLMRKTE